MSVVRRWILALLILCPTLNADEAINLDAPTVPADETPELIRDYVEEYRGVPISSKPCIKVAADVRFEYDRYRQVENGELVSGPGTKLPNDQFLVQANIYFEYKGRCDYAKLALNFRNDLGIFVNRNDSLRIKRAYFGYNIYQCDKTRWFAELGRQTLWTKFDSQVMFGSRLDGLFSQYETCLPTVGEFFVKGAAFVLTAEFDEYAYVVSTGLNNLYCRGPFVKLAYIDWTNAVISQQRINPDVKPPVEGANEANNVLTFQRKAPFRTVQILVGHDMKKLIACRDLKVFAAYLRNIDSRKIEVINVDTGEDEFVSQKNAWYVGASLGKVNNCGDWAIKFVYMYVQSFAYFPVDNNGIGRKTFTDNNTLFAVTDKKIQPVTNYKGWSLSAGYAISDHLSCSLEYQRAHDIDPTITGAAFFQRYKFEMIYAF